MSKPLEILCSACGADTLLRREPRYEGFRKTGERLLCSACGHEYASEEDVPFKQESTAAIFGEEDRPKAVRVFADEERGKNCRYCRHYVVNPFTQRCGLHDKEVQATDFCENFDPKPPAKDESGGSKTNQSGGPLA